jgi:hypothetical protein
VLIHASLLLLASLLCCCSSAGRVGPVASSAALEAPEAPGRGEARNARCTTRAGQAVPCDAPLVSWGNTTCLGDGRGGVRCVGEALLPPLPIGRLGADEPYVPAGWGDVAEIAFGAALVCVRRGDVQVSCWRRAGAGGLRPPLQRLRFPYGVDRIDQLIVQDAGPTVCARSGDRVLCATAGEAAEGGESFTSRVEALEGKGEIAQIFFGVRGEVAARLRSGQMLNAAGAPLLVAKDRPIEGAMDVATRGREACVLFRGGEVRCGAISSSYLHREVSFHVERAVSLAMGDRHVCVRLASGSVHCRGDGSQGQLGSGQLGYAGDPVPIVGLPPATEIAAGAAHSCALAAGGALWCWGSNLRGQLGRPLRRSAPALLVPGVGGAAGLAAGRDHTCAMIPGGSNLCWGGPGRSSSPAHWPAVADFRSISFGAGGGACGLLADGGAACSPELGGSLELVAVAGAAAATMLDGEGASPACAPVPGGPPVCWGNVGARIREQLVTPAMARARGTMAGAFSELVPVTWPRPTAVPGLGAVRAVSERGACFLMESGGVVSWWPECDGKRCERVVRPVAGLEGATAVAAGERACCGLVGGELACKRSEHESDLLMSDGGSEFTYQKRPVPAPTGAHVVPGGSGSTALAAWGDRVCVVIAGGKVSCGTIDGPPLEPVEGLEGAVEVVLGFRHGCARLGDGRVACWGDNASGQLGLGRPGAVEANIWPSPTLVGPAGEAAERGRQGDSDE